MFVFVQELGREYLISRSGPGRPDPPRPEEEGPGGGPAAHCACCPLPPPASPAACPWAQSQGWGRERGLVSHLIKWAEVRPSVGQENLWPLQSLGGTAARRRQAALVSRLAGPRRGLSSPRPDVQVRGVQGEAVLPAHCPHHLWGPGESGAVESPRASHGCGHN